jgi:hypothetical protein
MMVTRIKPSERGHDNPSFSASERSGGGSNVDPRVTSQRSVTHSHISIWHPPGSPLGGGNGRSSGGSPRVAACLPQGIRRMILGTQ